MKPGQTVEHEFPYVPTEAGVLRGRFEITHDRFPDDDRYLFAISVAPQIKVLLVNGNPTSDPFQNEALYLRTALTSTTPPEKSPAAKAPRRRRGRRRPRMQRLLQVVETTEPAVNPESLRDASVVILANCGRLNQQQFAWLRDYVHDGGGLMIFPGDRVNPGVYNSQLLLIPGPTKQKFLAVTMGAPLGDRRRSTRSAGWSWSTTRIPCCGCSTTPRPAILPRPISIVASRLTLDCVVRRRLAVGELLARGARPGRREIRRRPGSLGGVSRHGRMVQPAAETGVCAVGLADGQPCEAKGRVGRPRGAFCRKDWRKSPSPPLGAPSPPR